LAGFAAEGACGQPKLCVDLKVYLVAKECLTVRMPGRPLEILCQVPRIPR
jgi:hypothetical protein